MAKLIKKDQVVSKSELEEQEAQESEARVSNSPEALRKAVIEKQRASLEASTEARKKLGELFESGKRR